MQNIKHEKGNITQSSLNECIVIENLSSKCVGKKKKGQARNKNVKILALKPIFQKNCETEHEKNLIVEFKIFYFIYFLHLSQILTIKFISFIEKKINSHTPNLIEGN